MSLFSDTSPLVIQLSPELKQRLRDVSWQTQTAMATLVREAIVTFLEQRDRKAA